MLPIPWEIVCLCDLVPLLKGGQTVFWLAGVGLLFFPYCIHYIIKLLFIKV